MGPLARFWGPFWIFLVLRYGRVRLKQSKFEKCSKDKVFKSKRYFLKEIFKKMLFKKILVPKILWSPNIFLWPMKFCVGETFCSKNVEKKIVFKMIWTNVALTSVPNVLCHLNFVNLCCMQKFQHPRLYRSQKKICPVGGWLVLG